MDPSIPGQYKFFGVNFPQLNSLFRQKVKDNHSLEVKNSYCFTKFPALSTVHSDVATKTNARVTKVTILTCSMEIICLLDVNSEQRD